MRVSSSPAWQAVFLTMLLLASLAKPPHPTNAEYREGTVGFDTSGVRAQSRSTINDAYRKLPLSFEENHGQVDKEVKFLSRGSSYNLFLTASDALLELKDNRFEPAPRRHTARSTRLDGSTSSTRSASIRLELIGSNPAATLEAGDELPGKTNFFIGSDPRKWRTNVPTYARVKYESAYPGVDVVFYGNKRDLEYDFIVAPGANPRAIRLSFRGASKIRIDASGDLLMRTSAVEIRQRKPLACQRVGAVRKRVASRFKIRGKREVGFQVARYDRSKPLIIDPVLVYSTLLGGSNSEGGAGIAVDSAGNAYVTGKTDSNNFPTTPSAFQATSGDSASSPIFGDAFVIKLNATGTALIYSTYIGGGDEDVGHGIAVDSSGNVYVTGRTRSANFPTTPGSIQARGGGTNAFVVKLNGNGMVEYSTYLGGNVDFTSSIADGNGIAVDSLGNAFVTGVTYSGFPTTQGAYQTTYGGGALDAFVSKLNPSGTALVYSTFLGGNLYEHANAIALDREGNAYVTGSTGYSDTTFPRTERAFQTAFGGGALDAFVTKLNSTGTDLVYSTLIGGKDAKDTDGNEIGFGIAVDSAGNAYVTGSTGSRNFPTTPGAFQPAYGGGRSSGDAFVTKLNPHGTALIYSTYLGGSERESGSGIAIDSVGNAYVTGTTSSSNFPTTVPLQRKNSSGPAFKSTDGGNTWNPINDGLVSTSVDALAIDPESSSVIYAGTTAGLFKSTNGGSSWSVANVGSSSPLHVPAIAIDPQQPSTIYAGAQPGLFKSTDRGNTWRATSLMVRVWALAIDPLVPTTLYAGGNGGVLKSTDGGNSWQLINTGLPRPGSSVQPDPPSDPPPPFVVTALVIDPANPSTLFLSSNYGLYKTANAGESWRFVSNGFESIITTALLIDAKSSALYAGGGGGVIRSTDGGVKWSVLKAGLPGSVSLLAISLATSTTLYSSVNGYPTLGGLFKSLDGGDNWRPAGLSNMHVFALAIDPQNPSTLYSGTDSQMFVDDGFVTKLNAAGAALVYSTYFGGHSNDSTFGIAVDSASNAYVTGESGSGNFQTTAGAFQSDLSGGNSDAFIAKFSSPFAITNASVKGKKLFVRGDGFKSGAVIILNGEQHRTENDGTSPTTLLVARKAGKKIPVGQAVTIQVRNPDGTLSDESHLIR